MGSQCPRRRVATMSKVISHMTMSLDGEITTCSLSDDPGAGRHGTPWHDWQLCGHATSGGPRVLSRHRGEGLIWWSSAGEACAQAAIS